MNEEPLSLEERAYLQERLYKLDAQSRRWPRQRVINLLFAFAIIFGGMYLLDFFAPGNDSAQSVVVSTTPESDDSLTAQQMTRILIDENFKIQRLILNTVVGILLMMFGGFIAIHTIGSWKRNLHDALLLRLFSRLQKE